MTEGDSAAPGQQRRLAERIVATLPYVSLLGLGSLITNIMLSFEEPHAEMLFVSAALLPAAPLGMLVHLAVKQALTPNEKRMWITGLMSREGPTLFAEYFNASGRSRTTRKLAINVKRT
jgi:hypothetical protein